MDIEGTLKERGEQYGPFNVQSAIAQTLKKVMREHGWNKLSLSQREALDHIQTKVSRILNGNPDHIDSWRDISGYSTLIVQQLTKPPAPPSVD